MNKNHALRTSVLVLAGLLVSLVYVSAVGLLAIRAIGARDGAVFDLTNTLVAITEPHVPYVEMVSIAIMGLLVIFILLVGTVKLRLLDRLAFSGGFSVGAAALVLYSFLGLDVSRANTSIVEGGLVGWRGWIYKAGSDSSVHLVLALALGWMLLHVLETARTSRFTESKNGS